MVPLSFATFWAGTSMAALDKACLVSFVNAGYRVALYSYDRIDDLPSGVELRDARDITPAADLGAFLYQGRPNISHFSDYFRYKMFLQRGAIWFDTDMLLLKPLSFDGSRDLFAKETDASICNAIMFMRSNTTTLPELIKRTESLKNKDLVWGATGPRLLTQIVGKKALLEEAHDPGEFFPVHFDDFWKPFLPAYREECEHLCREALTLHLWNNIVVQLGVWKELAPPKDSFLWSQLHKQGTLPLFRDTYPAAVMERMVLNWKLRKSGGDIGALKVARQIIPSMLRTIAPRIQALVQMRR